MFMHNPYTYNMSCFRRNGLNCKALVNNNNNYCRSRLRKVIIAF